MKVFVSVALFDGASISRTSTTEKVFIMPPRNTESGSILTVRGTKPNDVNTNLLSFWDFVSLAERRIPTETISPDLDSTRVILSLNRAANFIVQDLEDNVHKPHNLTWSEFRLLFVIWLVQEVEPKNASRLTGMSRAVVSTTTRKLENLHLISRQNAAADGRSIRLSLTSQGHEKITHVYGLHNKREGTWVETLTPAEQQILVMLLNKLVRGS